MMYSYDDYRSKSGFPVTEIRRVYEYRAYKDGECRTFSSQEDAKKFSPLIEKYIVNEHEWNDYKHALEVAESKAYDLWYNDLRERHSELSEKVFDICLSEAYERGHYAGYDEVANLMYGVVEFAKNVIESVK